ncbi:bifunctional 2',3'-cyclic-nucleotide 2'-phosphodiesterase/3'-nucleotidase [Streptococcus loxodontisalivarius]|uniref:2',3'-cyclic-nucleotide 2'-phosphodiesterase/3'-nucleotidase n=1 Tax=Streptococcus loxodontisalivarius TaxID=1349415 RepID=A0ABS2PQS5_9STRE|nr:bifunctional 2',3'-cyclic-nucleotide 2'-phosphodiesterase/3'-nucleotidase [Streptococcus loxodontisalivarius]MBM7642293.1 2',3'-cyclic-nucleotide 2'-phosphodiesterase/3'-nucleotidase [Streptococcus loxodontisalivarius]
MAKSYIPKSAVLLSALVLATSSQLVKADEVETTRPTDTTEVVTSSDTSATEASANSTLTDSSLDANATSSAQTTADASAETNISTSPVADSSAIATSTENLEESGQVASPVTEATTASSNDSTTSQAVEGESVNVRILSTTDLHTNLVNYDYYQDKASQSVGLAKTAVLIEAAKAENSNVVLVDNGDIIQGTPLGTYEAIIDPVQADEEHPMYQALNALGYDASTLGNHEFNYGLDFLGRLIATANLPIVNANVLDATTKEPLYKTYEIITKTFTDTEGKPVTLKIGITGIVPPQILSWDKANLEGKVIVEDSVQAITKVVPEMRQAGADIVLVLSHSGIGDDQYEVGEENEGYQIAGIEGVDAVVTGHSHATFPSGDGTGSYESLPGVDGINGKINGTPVTMAGKYGDHLGIIDLSLTYTDGKWQVTDSKGQIRKIDTKSDVADSRVIEIAQEAHNGTIAYVRQEVGTTTAPINSYFALVQDDPSIQIVNNAQLWYAKQELAGTEYANLPLLSAAAPFKAGTRNDATAYTDIPAGPIAIKNVADLYLYDNVAAILKITGADLKEWLEMSAGQFNQVDPTSTEPQNLVNTDYRTYNFDVIDGVTYEYDITQPNKYDKDGKLVNADASRVRNLKYQGQDVTDDQEFMVISNNYRASGNFPGVRNASVNYLLNLENRQVIINYIVAEKTINPSADANWTFTDSIKGLDLRFLTADTAQSLISNMANINYLGASDSEGFGVFQFVYVEKAKDDSQDSTDTNDQNQNQDPTNKQSLSEETKQDIYQTVAKAYQETLAQKQTVAKSAKQTPTAEQNQLPQTASQEGNALSLLGLSILGLLGFTSIKKRKQ